MACERCPRLRSYCAEVARVKRRAFLDQEYWGRPVPPFGEAGARLLVIGLAPAAHGGNRTGRIFTGDRSGDFLFDALHHAGYAALPYSVSRDDGQQLTGAYISAVVRCAPPDNKPLPQEIRNCRPYLERELELLDEVRAVVALGRVAFDGYLAVLRARGDIASRAPFVFRHGAEYVTGPGQPLLIASYHPSQQNTSTGKLTQKMLREVFERAARVAPPRG